MTYARFALYNVTGAIAWVASFLLAGYFFGQLPFVKRNFHLVILAIIVISVIPDRGGVHPRAPEARAARSVGQARLHAGAAARCCGEWLALPRGCSADRARPPVRRLLRLTSPPQACCEWMSDQGWLRAMRARPRMHASRGIGC